MLDGLSQVVDCGDGLFARAGGSNCKGVLFGLIWLSESEPDFRGRVALTPLGTGLGVSELRRSRTRR